MRDQEKWLEWADLYAVGALDGPEREAFEARLNSGCEICLTRLKENQAALSGVMQGMPLLSPDPSVKFRLMESLGGEAVSAGVFAPAIANSSPVWAALGIWILISLGVLWGWQHTALQRHTREFKRLESAMMTTAQAKAVNLKALQGVPSSVSGKMMWNAKGDCLFLTMGLPKTAREKAYEVWGIAGNKPVAIGTFTVDEHGCGVLAMKKNEPISFEKFAVTVEPSGGVPAPTGPMVLLGQVA